MISCSSSSSVSDEKLLRRSTGEGVVRVEVLAVLLGKVNSSSSLEGSDWASEGVSGRQGSLEAARLAKWFTWSRDGMAPEWISSCSVDCLSR